MPHKTTNNKCIAILATGNEITHGDTLNTNAQDIAKSLNDNCIKTNTHMVVTDSIEAISQAINYLLKNHDGIIITGGLGPTSDDVTRFGLAKALKIQLDFKQSAWNDITALLKKSGVSTPPESNRQQALFPASASIIKNNIGTAAGCHLEINKKNIFMLPGPPNECLPMINNAVLPALKNSEFTHQSFLQRWLLFGVSEAQIAEVLDRIAFKNCCTTGYRFCYPYLEFKLLAENEKKFKKASPAIQREILSYIIGNGFQTASAWLIEQLLISKKSLKICDQATGGLLETTIKTPKTYKLLNFVSDNKTADIYISGLTDFWNEQNSPYTQLSISFQKSKKKDINLSAPLRGEQTKLYTVEWLSREIGKWLYF